MARGNAAGSKIGKLNFPASVVVHIAEDREQDVAFGVLTVTPYGLCLLKQRVRWLWLLSLHDRQLFDMEFRLFSENCNEISFKFFQYKHFDLLPAKFKQSKRTMNLISQAKVDKLLDVAIDGKYAPYPWLKIYTNYGSERGFDLEINGLMHDGSSDVTVTTDTFSLGDLYRTVGAVADIANDVDDYEGYVFGKSGKSVGR